MDRIDARILRALQTDSSRPVAELAREVGLSASACHRRVKLLEESGVIAGYAARLDRAALGFSIQAFVEITLNSQSQEALNSFETAVMRFDEILECHLTTGQADYILRVVARDVAGPARIGAYRAAAAQAELADDPLSVLFACREARAAGFAGSIEEYEARARASLGPRTTWSETTPAGELPSSGSWVFVSREPPGSRSSLPHRSRSPSSSVRGSRINPSSAMRAKISGWNMGSGLCSKPPSRESVSPMR